MNNKTITCFNWNRITNCTEFNPYKLYIDAYLDEYRQVDYFNGHGNAAIFQGKMANILKKLDMPYEYRGVNHHPVNHQIENMDDMDDEGIFAYYTVPDLGVLIEIASYSTRSYIVKMFSAGPHVSAEIQKGAKQLFEKMIAAASGPRPSSKNKFSIICFSDGSFYLKAIDLDKKADSSDLPLRDLYNDDFEEASTHILEQLQVSNKGIVLLHGEPGTGKSNFLKHIISNLGNKQIIYMPPDMTHLISKPEFFTFLLNHKKSILLIEDAENVLKEREAGDAQAVSNLLNVSDGILGNALKFQIVATLNSPLEHVDKALLRPGRLIASYHFKKLPVEKANKLLKKLFNAETNAPLTLAEIFNFTQKKFVSKTEKGPVGFC